MSVRQKILILEFWGLGDAVLMTTVLAPLLSAGHEVHLACKPTTVELLRPFYPDVRYHPIDVPWTAFRGKYRLWRWDWRALSRMIRALRSERFDAVTSVRHDPRDHVVMFLLGIPVRTGFPRVGSHVLLTNAVERPMPPQHKVKDWRLLLQSLMPDMAASVHDASPALSKPCQPDTTGLPLVLVHCGARIPVRRWPESYFADLLGRMKGHFSVRIALVPDPDGYGTSLEGLVDEFVPATNLGGLVALMCRARLMVCNDSGPMHIAAALGVETLSLFGPTDRRQFAPFGPGHLVLIRDICPHRPCFDHCRFPEPYCMTRLLPAEIWPEAEAWLRARLRAMENQNAPPLVSRAPPMAP